MTPPRVKSIGRARAPTLSQPKRRAERSDAQQRPRRIGVFAGGFVGVDVFFVISGFLITSILLREHAQDRFSLLTFYERRARRILPALFAVILVCLPLAWFRLEPKGFVDFAESIIAVNLFASNFLFWSEANYFDTATELKPLLHTWSLAVEEQFYIFFPLLLMALWRHGLGVITITLAVIFAGSLALSEYQAVHAPTANFYLLPTRAWELLIGCFCAIVIHRYGWMARRFDDLPAALGLALILFAVFFFDGSTPFPSLAALIPTVGTALIILFATPHTVTARLLSLKPMVAIGLISYSAYLWHQPLLAFAKIREFGHLSPFVIAQIVALTFVLATLTYFFVEQPFRGRAMSRKRLVQVLAPLPVVTIAAATAIMSNEGYEYRVAQVYSDEARAYEQAYIDSFTNDTHTGQSQADVDLPVVLIIGDSYLTAWSIGLRSVIDETQFRVVSISYLGCDVTDGTTGNLFDVEITNTIFTAYCRPFEALINDPALIEATQYVIWTSHRVFEYASNPFRFDMMNTLMTRIPQARLFVTGSYHQMHLRENPSCVGVMFTAGTGAEACMAKSVYPTPNMAYTSHTFYDQMTVPFEMLDPITLFCEDGGTCPHEANGVPFIWDWNHLTAAFLVQELPKAIRRHRGYFDEIGLLPMFDPAAYADSDS